MTPARIPTRDDVASALARCEARIAAALEAGQAERDAAWGDYMTHTDAPAERRDDEARLLACVRFGDVARETWAEYDAEAASAWAEYQILADAWRDGRAVALEVAS